MKKLITILAIFFISAAWISAVEIYTEETLSQLGLPQDQITQILQIQEKYQNQIREAALEMNVYKAKLAKMLYSNNPNMDQVRKLLEESLQYRLQSEMAAIKQRTETRKAMGEENWQKMVQLQNRLQKEEQNMTQTRTRTQAQTESQNGTGTSSGNAGSSGGGRNSGNK